MAEVAPTASFEKSATVELRTAGKLIVWNSQLSLEDFGPTLEYQVRDSQPGARYRIKLNLSEGFCVLDVRNHDPQDRSVEKIRVRYQKPYPFRGKFLASASLQLQHRDSEAGYSWQKEHNFTVWGGELTTGLSLVTGNQIQWSSFHERYVQIGRGSYSQVVRYSSASQSLAVKVSDPYTIYGVNPGLSNEMAILAGLTHPNIIKITDFVVGKEMDYSALVMPLGQGDFFHLLNGVNISGSEMGYFRQMVSAVGYLHSRSIYHGDLKSANFIVYGEEVRLADFGISYRGLLHSEREKEFFSESYRAPELWSGGAYTPAADVWALGCILLEMYDPEHDGAFKGLDDIYRVLGRPIALGGPSPGAGFSFPLAAEVKKLLLRFLEVEVSRRASLSDLAQDPLLDVRLPEPVPWTELMREEFPHRLRAPEALTPADYQRLEKVNGIVARFEFDDRTRAVAYALNDYGKHSNDEFCLYMAFMVAGMIHYTYSAKIVSSLEGLEQKHVKDYIVYYLRLLRFRHYSWTAYDILMLLSQEGEPERRARAHTLLQCLYYTFLGRSHSPRTVADFCWALAARPLVLEDKWLPLWRQALTDWSACRGLTSCDRGYSATKLLKELRSLSP